MEHLDEPSQPQAHARQSAHARQAAHVAESPWFWFAIFLCFALLALAVIGPKHIARQTRLVRMHEARQQARFRSPLERDALVRRAPRGAANETAAGGAAAGDIAAGNSAAGNSAAGDSAAGDRVVGGALARPSSPPDRDAARYAGASLTALACFLGAALMIAIAAAYRARGRQEQGSTR